MTGQLLALRTGHVRSVLSVAFAPDSQTLVPGGEDKTVRLWYPTTGVQLGPPLKGHTNAVSSVAFAPDERTLASGSADRTVRLWDLDPNWWVQQACASPKRTLTRDELVLYMGPSVPFEPACA
jgi:WD40 repeat protein